MYRLFRRARTSATRLKGTARWAAAQPARAGLAGTPRRRLDSDPTVIEVAFLFIGLVCGAALSYAVAAGLRRNVPRAPPQPEPADTNRDGDDLVR